MKRYRKLGFTESFCAALQDKLQGGLLCVMAAEIAGFIPEEIIKKVFTLIYQQDPLLRVVLQQSEGFYYFAEPLQPQAIPYQIESADKSFDINKVVEFELNHPLNSAEHLWRARIIFREDQKTFIIFTMNHAITDGISLIKLISRLVDYCNKLVSGKETPTLSLALLPPLEHVLAKINPVLAKNIAIDQDNVPIAWQFSQPVLLTQRTAKVFTLNRSVDFIEKLHQLSHAKGATVNSVLLAAILLTVKQAFPQIPAVCVVPIDIRSRCHPPLTTGQLAMLASDAAVDLIASVGNDDFWQIAAVLQQQFLQRASAVMHASPDYTLADLQQVLAPLEDLEQKQFLVPLSLTNLEDCRNLQQSAPFAIKDIFLGVSTKPGQVGMIIAVMTLMSGFNFIINYTEPMVSRDLVKEFGEAVLQRLDALLIDV